MERDRRWLSTFNRGDYLVLPSCPQGGSTRPGTIEVHFCGVGGGREGGRVCCGVQVHSLHPVQCPVRLHDSPNAGLRDGVAAELQVRHARGGSTIDAAKVESDIAGKCPDVALIGLLRAGCPRRIERFSLVLRQLGMEEDTVRVRVGPGGGAGKGLRCTIARGIQRFAPRPL